MAVVKFSGLARQDDVEARTLALQAEAIPLQAKQMWGGEHLALAISDRHGISQLGGDRGRAFGQRDVERIRLIRYGWKEDIQVIRAQLRTKRRADISNRSDPINPSVRRISE